MDKNIVAIFICCFMPVCIVAIIFLSRYLSQRLRANVAIKAIESGSPTDVSRFFDSKHSSARPAMAYLRNSLILFAVGLSMLIYLILESDYENVLMLPTLILIFSGIAFLILYFVARRAQNTKRNADCDDDAR